MSEGAVLWERAHAPRKKRSVFFGGDRQPVGERVLYAAYTEFDKREIVLQKLREAGGEPVALAPLLAAERIEPTPALSRWLLRCERTKVLGRGMAAWVPHFPVHRGEDIAHFLRNQERLPGFERQKVEECYPGAAADVERLVSDGTLLWVRGSGRVIFNDAGGRRAPQHVRRRFWATSPLGPPDPGPWLPVVWR